MASTSTGRTGKKYSTEEVLAELFAESDSGGEDFGDSDSNVDISVMLRKMNLQAKKLLCKQKQNA